VADKLDDLADNIREKSGKEDEPENPEA